MQGVIYGVRVCVCTGGNYLPPPPGVKLKSGKFTIFERVVKVSVMKVKLLNVY